MVNLIEVENVNDAFVQIARLMRTVGHRNCPRDLETIELNDAWITIADIANPIVSLPARDIKIDYLRHEMDWYNSGSLKAEDIAEHASMWAKLADTNGTVNSNYGFLTKIEKWSGISQVEWCIARLNQDINSRQAVINYNQPRHKYPHVKDFVCTLSQQFIVRDGKLDTIVMMRSNDLIYGLTYDIPWFAKLQREIAEATGIPIGKYHHYAASLHVYEKHFELLENIANEKLSGKKE